MNGDLLLILLGIAALSARLGLCLYQTGLSQSKNAAAAVTRSMADLCVAILAFWAVGNAVLTRHPGALFGRHNSFDAWAFFNAIAASIATGAALGGTLERTRLLPSLCVSGLLAGIVFPLSLRWAWHGWIHDMRYLDVGGSSFIHLTAGLSAAAGAVASGPRLGKYNHDGSSNHIPGHHVPLTAIGALCMVIGWLALIVGYSSQRAAPNMIGSATDGLMAAAAGGMAAMCLGRIRSAITDYHLICIGMMAGLVSISAAAGHVSAATSVVLGGIGGGLAAYASGWIDMSRRIDDPAAAVAIHAVGGAWGLLVAGLIFTPPVILVQMLGLAVMGGIALAAALGVFYSFRFTVGLRPGEADELDGADLADHDLNAYPDFQQSMIKSHHLRQM
jgi:ammonium transporter, Amt family